MISIEESSGIFKKKRDEFKLLSKIDSTHGELFFSKRVILVEGNSERLCPPLIVEKMNYSLPQEGISVIEAEGKKALPFFQKLMNALGIQYLVVYDEDPVDGNKTGDRLAYAMSNYDYNRKIEACIHGSSKPLMVEGNLKNLLGVSCNQANHRGKPLADYKRDEQLQLSDIPAYFTEALRDFIIS